MLRIPQMKTICALFSIVAALEPLAIGGTQDVWQAASPVEVDIDYDIPSNGRKSLLQKLPTMARVGKVLQDTCGLPCVTEWNNVKARTNLSEKDIESGKWAAKVGNMFESNIHSMKSLLAQTKTLSATQFSTSKPCDSPESCKIAELFSNKCSYARVGVLTTYNAFNVGTHVLGSITSVLCGCVHVGSKSKCPLENVPPICVFPYHVYKKAYSASSQLWEAAKGLAKTCQIQGDARVSS